jgi:hypothetical protein
MVSAPKKGTQKKPKPLSLYPMSLEEALKIALTTPLPEKEKKPKRKARKKS